VRIIAEEFEFVDSPKKNDTQENTTPVVGVSGTGGYDPL
jgi:hypothetical protein